MALRGGNRSAEIAPRLDPLWRRATQEEISARVRTYVAAQQNLGTLMVGLTPKLL